MRENVRSPSKGTRPEQKRACIIMMFRLNTEHISYEPAALAAAYITIDGRMCLISVAMGATTLSSQSKVRGVSP